MTTQELIDALAVASKVFDGAVSSGNPRIGIYRENAARYAFLLNAAAVELCALNNVARKLTETAVEAAVARGDRERSRHDAVVQASAGAHRREADFAEGPRP